MLSSLPGFSPSEDRKNYISKTQTSILPKVEHYVYGFRAFMESVMAIPSSNMIDVANYGKIHKEYWDAVNSSTREDAIAYIDTCENMVNSQKFHNVISVDMSHLLMCIWFLATEKTFSASDFQRATTLFCELYI